MTFFHFALSFQSLFLDLPLIYRQFYCDARGIFCDYENKQYLLNLNFELVGCLDQPIKLRAVTVPVY